MRLPEDKRNHFKEPLGKLFDSSAEAFNYLRETGEFEEIITVGDFVSVEFLREDIVPDMIIVDFSIERSPVEDELAETIKKYHPTTFEVKNPAGHITDELWDAVQRAETPVKIVVDGEEDLAVVPAVLRAPEGSLVAYGQPGEGMVFVEIGPEEKKKVKELVQLFE